MSRKLWVALKAEKFSKPSQPSNMKLSVIVVSEGRQMNISVI